MKNKKYIALASLIILITLLIFSIGYFISISPTPLKIEKDTVLAVESSPNQTFNLTTIKGEKFQLSLTPNHIKIKPIENKIIFLKVFGWDCEYCKQEIDELVKLKKELGDVFEVIAIESQRHSLKENEQFAKEYAINYHIVMGEKFQRLCGYFIEHYDWSGVIPLSIVIGEDGKVLAFETGYKSYTLAELLKTSIIKGEKND
ncbi:MAG: TlpA family protein disulfide reductase [Sulfurovaceae bacterium]|nr:TlpA family protein disulfide reductase [Sulfurovaceae bacterium]